MRTIAAEDLAPWCKMNNIVFRATEVADRGHELSITARVRIDDVAHALEGFRGERGHRGDDARFTWTGRSRYVRVKSAESTTTSARSRIMRLNLEAVDAPHDSSIEMSIGKLTPNDLTELALRTALFGDPNPLKISTWFFSQNCRTRCSRSEPRAFRMRSFGLSRNSLSPMASSDQVGLHASPSSGWTLQLAIDDNWSCRGNDLEDTQMNGSSQRASPARFSFSAP